jgi:predicted TIM-barrel fold metal-dependent hydrolase
VNNLKFITAALTLAACSAQSAAPPEMKFGVPVKAGPMDSVLLKDYKPDSSLVTPKTRVEKAKYPVIDVHSHSSMSNIKTPEDVAAWLRTMDETGIEMSVVFTEATGADFDRQMALFRPHPKRFQVYAGIDTSDFESPGFSERVAAELERCYRMGARGVGELTDKGWGLQASEAGAVPRARRLRVDDPRLDAFWRKCAELKIPVNLHIADHPSCWKPLGPNQERTPDFQAFNLAAKDVPSYEELLASRDRMLARHPKTTYILCHLSNQGNDTASLARVLDRYPNLYLDMSARDYELGRQPRTARQFLTRYQNRIMFGTDMGRDKAMYQGWWQLLETADEYLPGRIWWPYYGLELPPAVLKSIYRDTALKVLSLR